VLLGNGDGTFAAKVNYPTASAPRGLVAADLNGDGKIDLAVASAGSDTVSVLLNEGNGTFPAQVDYPTGPVPVSIAAVDLNGDGKPDLAVACSSVLPSYVGTGVSVLINHGDGTFAAKVDYPTGGGGSAVSVTAADLNGDGKPDLAALTSGSADVGNTVTVMLNNGDGTLATPVDYPSEEGPLSIAVADLNGDGKPDLAVVNDFGSNVSVLLNHGDGTFAAKVDYVTAYAPDSVAVADMNGDGKPDLVVANAYGTMTVLLGNGDGTFAAMLGYASGLDSRQVVVADLNGDGKPDLAVANSGITIGTGTVSVLLDACLP